MADFIDPFDSPAGDFIDPFDTPSSAPEKPKKTSAIRGIADLGLGFASGAVGATKALADAAGAGSGVSSALNDVNEGITGYLSDSAKADQREQGRIMQAAEGKGTWEGIKAGARAFGVAPLQTAVSGLGSVVPVAAGAAATTLTGGGAPAVLATGLGIGATMGAGTVKGAIFDEVKRRGIESGMSESDAIAEATKAQEYGGGNTGNIAVGAGLGAADAATGVTKAATNIVRNAIIKPAVTEAVKASGRGIVGRTLTGIAGEMPLEAAQGGQEKYAANVAAQRAGYDVDPWAGVASQATLEALASAGPGAAFGAFSGAGQKRGDKLPADAAAVLNESVGGDQRAVPTLVTNIDPLHVDLINRIVGADIERMSDNQLAQYEKDIASVFDDNSPSETVGYTTDANGLEIPFTMRDYVKSTLASADITRDRPKAENANQVANLRAQDLADEESRQQPDIASGYVAPDVPVVGTLSAMANMAIQSGAHKQSQMQQAMQAAVANQKESNKGTANAAQVKPLAQEATQTNDAQAGLASSAAQAASQGTGSVQVSVPQQTNSDTLAPSVEANYNQLSANSTNALAQTTANTATTEKRGIKPLNKWTAEELQNRLDRGAATGDLSPDSRQSIEARLSVVKAADAENAAKEAAKADRVAKMRAANEANKGTFLVGTDKDNTERVSVRNGTVYLGDYAAEDFETGDDITVPEGATKQQIFDALINGKAVTGKIKIFGKNGPEQSAADRMAELEAERSAMSPVEREAAVAVEAAIDAVVSAADRNGIEQSTEPVLSYIGASNEEIQQSNQASDDDAGAERQAEERQAGTFAGSGREAVGSNQERNGNAQGQAGVVANQNTIKNEAPAAASVSAESVVTKQEPIKNYAPKQKAVRNKIDPEKDSLFVAIAKAGGMDTDELLRNGIDSSDITRETAGRVNKKTGALSKKRRMPISYGFAMPLHKKGGMSFDSMREAMQQYGYLPDGATKSEAIDLFRRELSGDAVYTPQSIELRREQDQEAFDKMMLEEQDRIDAELAAREIVESDYGYNELSNEAQSLADDFAEIAFGESGKQDNNAIRAGMRALGFTEEEINDELAKNSQAQRESEEITEGAGQDGGAGRNGNRTEDAQARQRNGEEGFDLAGQTNGQAAEQFAQRQAGENDAPTKEQADRERDAVPFSLGMQSQPKPQGVQTVLFTADGRVSAEVKKQEEASDEQIAKLAKRSVDWLRKEGGESVPVRDAIKALALKQKMITEEPANWTPRDSDGHPLVGVWLYKTEARAKLGDIGWAITNLLAHLKENGDQLPEIAEVKQKAVKTPLSSVIDKANAKYGEGLTEADRVPLQYNTMADVDSAITGIYDGTVSLEDYKAAFNGLLANKEAITAELGKMTIPQLHERFGKQPYGRPEKKGEIVERAFEAVRNTFALRRSFGPSSYTMSTGGLARYEADKLSDLTEMVESTTAEDLKKFSDEIANTRAARQEKIEAAQDPKTTEDFDNALRLKKAEGMTFAEARMSLTPEQRAEYDRLKGIESRDRRKARADQQKADIRTASQTTDGQVVETKHTKTGEPLFVVKAAERVDRDIYNLWNTTAKRMGGYYSSFRGNGAVPGFQFKTRENADAFLAFIGGNAEAAKEVVQERRDAFADDRSQSAIERLNEMAERLEEKADESLGRERKANTERRARFAASAESAANAEKAMAKTMRRIASAISDGTTKFLDRVRQKSQVEYLAATLRAAKGVELRTKYPSYVEQQRHEGEPATGETADYAEFPQYAMMRSDLANLARKMVALPNMKMLGQRILKSADDTSTAYNAFAKEHLLEVSQFGKSDGSGWATFSTLKDAERSIEVSNLTDVAVPLQIKRGEYRLVLSPSEAINRGIWKGDDRKIFLSPEIGEEIVEKLGRPNRKHGKRRGMDAPPEAPWQFENAYNNRKRLAGLGIEHPWEFRAALREFADLKESPQEADKIKAMERAMIGRKNDGLDFFPTPADTAQAMIDAAEITEGMSVLEPSAGMGHIAEKIRDAGNSPDVIEFNSDRRELLEAKGFNVVGRDFIEFNGQDKSNLPDGEFLWDFFRKTAKAVRSVKDSIPGWDVYDKVIRGTMFVPNASSETLAIAAAFEMLEQTSHLYDRIIMNPPFSNRRDAEHVQHAYSLLRPSGRVVAIMGEGVFFGQDKKAQAFREWLDEVGGTSEKLEEGTFLDPSLPVNTATNARMVVIDKPAGDTAPVDNEGAGSITSNDKLTPADQAIYGMAAEGKSAAEILKFIASASRSPINRQLAKLLQKTGIAPVVTVGDSKGWKMNAGEGHKYAAAYNPKTDTVALFRPASAERHILHELIHASTIRALGKKGLASIQMKALFAHVQKNGKSVGLFYDSNTKRGVYGMADVDEFIAEAFSNPKFQEMLKQVSAPSTSNLKSGWHWFVRIVRNILGLPQGQENALSQAIEIGLGVMREDMKLRNAEAGVPFAEITGKEIEQTIGRTIQEKASNWMRAKLQGKTFRNDATGWDISVGRKGINKTISHGAKETHARSVAAIPSLLKNAILVESEENRNEKERDDVPMVHHFYAPLRTGGGEYIAHMVVKETRNGQRFYDYETSDEISPAVPEATHTFSQVRGVAPSARLTMSMTKLLSHVKKEHGGTDPKFMRYAKDDTRTKQTDTEAFRKWFGNSAVVDANGEPLVVYHGSDVYFNIFERGKNKAFDPRGFYFSPFKEGAESYSARGTGFVKQVYLSIKNPYIAKSYMDVSKMSKERIADLEAKGYDGAYYKPDLGKPFSYYYQEEWVAFRAEQIKSATDNAGSFDATNPDIRYSKAAQIIGDSGRPYDQTQRDFFKNVGRDINPQTRIEKATDYLKNDFWKKMAIGIVDQFRGLRDLNDNGQAYILARLSKGTAGAFDALLHHGKLSLKDGVYDADTSGGFVERLGVPLNGELDDVLWWIAANRAEGLAAQGKENLFSPQDIAAGKSLATGKTKFDYTMQTGPLKGKTTRDRAAIYADANRVFNEFQKNTLDMAEQSGLIDGASRQYWESEFYVPFYRVSEEDGEFIGSKMGNALVRQQAFKKLKGGTDKLNSDLLSNTLLNWSHLIEASAKNRAAKASLTAAEKIGAAQRVASNMGEYAASNGAILPPGTKKTVWFQDKGQKQEYLVTDPFVMTAITSLEYAGMRNGIMDVLTKFKHYLTIGVTASPAFKVRNLIRDSIQAIGTSDLSYNPIKNVTEGFKQTKRDSQEYVSALASGGLIRFGTMLEGSESSRVRQLIKAGVKDSTILNTEDKWQAFYDQYLDPAISAYNELGNRSEEINRAALYNQLIKQGKSHAEAALLARDLMDFSMQGSFNTIRFLTQTVPFLNARLVGMYKLGRAAKENPKKMAIVTGVVALAGMSLLLAYGDDDDWKKREDWDLNNFFWFKFGDVAFRIPRPFEIGAVASLAERSLQYMIDDEMTGERFRKVVGHLLMDNLSMNPTPQAIKPIVDLYANRDSFTGRPIETMGMDKLDPTERYTSNTSMVARGASKALMGAASPVQIDHLARSYFGWIGSFVVGGADMAARAMNDEPTKPTLDYFKFSTQGIVSEANSPSSRYVTNIYDQAKELEQAYGTWRRMIKEGKIEDAQEYAADNRDKLNRYKSVESVKKIEAKFTERIRQIERSNIDPDEKKSQIANVNRMKDFAARRLTPGYSE